MVFGWDFVAGYGVCVAGADHRIFWARCVCGGGCLSFDGYFGISEEMPYLEKLAAFAAGLAPRPYHLKYLDLSKVNLENRRGPAVAPACTLAASLIATSIVKIVAGIRVQSVPHYTQIDLYRSKFRKGYLVWGGRNPIQKLKRRIILMKFKKAMTSNS